MPYVPQSDYKTSKGNVAPDFHWQGADATPAEKAQLKSIVETQYRPAKVVRDATRTYNCHAFAHANRHAWFNQIDQFLKDDYYQYTPGQLRLNDICVFVKDGQLTHSAAITALAGNTIVELRSKWGAWPEVLHGPTNVPEVYGKIVYYLRKRGTKFTDMEEPTIENINSKVDDLIYSLLTEEKKNQILLASTPSVIKLILNGFSEFSELQLYGSYAGERIVQHLKNTEDIERFLILSYAIQEIKHKEAAFIIANKIVTESENEFNFSTILLYEIFENLREDRSNLIEYYKSKLHEIQSFLKKE